MMSPMDVCFAVIGGGNGGLAMAGYLAYRGFSVNLYNRTQARIQSLIEDPRIDLSGSIEGTGILNLVTSNLKEAIRETDIIMVTTPATGHYDLARLMAPHLEDGQIIVLNPGRTGGALEVYETLRSFGCKKDIVVAEAQTFIYACRATGPKIAKIFSVKHEVALAAIPAIHTKKVTRLLSGAYPQFTPAKNVMETSINNFGAIFHPAPTLLNSGHIERGETFEYYLGILSSLVTSMLTNYVLSKIEAARMSVFGNLGTVVSIFAGSFFLKEPIYLYHIVGSLMIITGVIGTNYIRLKTKTPDSQSR
jgi:opine dehydrogenase